MHALDILGDPVRRRILELLADGESSAGDLGMVIQREFGITQPAVSQHLRVLRETGFATVRPEGTRRVYVLEPGPLAAADEWFDGFRRFWVPRLDALGTELARGRRHRRLMAEAEARADAAAEEASDDAPATPGDRPRSPDLEAQHPDGDDTDTDTDTHTDNEEN